MLHRHGCTCISVVATTGSYAAAAAMGPRGVWVPRHFLAGELEAPRSRPKEVNVESIEEIRLPQEEAIPNLKEDRVNGKLRSKRLYTSVFHRNEHLTENRDVTRLPSRELLANTTTTNARLLQLAFIDPKVSSNGEREPAHAGTAINHRLIGARFAGTQDYLELRAGVRERNNDRRHSPQATYSVIGERRAGTGNTASVDRTPDLARTSSRLPPVAMTRRASRKAIHLPACRFATAGGTGARATRVIRSS